MEKQAARINSDDPIRRNKGIGSRNLVLVRDTERIFAVGQRHSNRRQHMCLIKLEQMKRKVENN